MITQSALVGRFAGIAPETPPADGPRGQSTAAGIAAHAIGTNLRKKKLIDGLIAEGIESDQALS